MQSSSISLKQRVAHAGGWSLSGHFGAQALRLVSNVILTRLLVPELFGVMSIAVAFYIALAMFSDVGLQQNVVQHARDDDEPFLNTIWTAQIIRGALIAAIGCGIAGALLAAQLQGALEGGSAYAHPSLPIAVAIVSATGLIAGFNSTNLMTAGRQLHLGPTVKVELLGQLGGFAVTIAWALVSPTIYAVVSGAVASTLLRCLLSHIMVPGIRNRPCWAQEHYSKIHHLGTWILLSSMLGFLMNTGDRLLFGGILPAAEFGVYAVALLLIAAPLDVVMRLGSSVIYPALAELHRRDASAVADALYRFRLWLDPAAFFICGAILTSSDLIVRVLFGPAFQGIAAILPILALALLVAGQFPATGLYTVIGKPRLMTMLILVRVIALYVSGPILAMRYGMIGAAWAVAISSLIVIPSNLLAMARLGFLRPIRELLGVPFLLLGLAAGLLLTSLGALV